MSSFISNLVENFVESKTNSNQNESTSYSETSTYNSSYNNPPSVPYPWRADWDDREQRCVYIHQETGERVWEYDEVIRRTSGYQSGDYQQGAAGEYHFQQPSGYQQGGEDYSEQSGGYGRREGYYESEQVEATSGGGGHGMAYGALGAAAGLAAGAGKMYEGEKIHDDYEEDEYRPQKDVENFPENAAQWTGEKVSEVESIPQDIEYGVDRFDNRVEQKFDDAVYDVEDAPERVSGWVGERVGDVERFDDDIDNAYDQGRNEGYNNPGW